MKVEEVLKTAKKTWEEELARLESEIKPKLAKIAELRDQIAGSANLLALLESGTPKSQNNKGIDAPSDQRFTPTQAYWVPILEALVEMGGRGKVEQILRAVE